MTKPSPFPARRRPAADTAAPVEAPPPNPTRLHMEVAHTPDEIAHRLHWEQALDAGLIENRNPPPAPDVVAIREANDRLFRARAARHRREGIREWGW